ncbi:zinc-ribbon domain-containing protein [Woodsholea maritima]|uniref:zinc-ribbon domain-containing protein n=1 Tax=Woodsholea maritima TaxID=240237 RepID=UPI00037DDFE3|nr:zinc-ribbon domain-containing protein [Woodsholea maritima]
MIVTCPSCDAKYRASEEALNASGRKVRCAACAHVWIADEEPLPLNDPIAEATFTEDPHEHDQAAELEKPVKPHQKIRERAKAKERQAFQIKEISAWGGVAASFIIALTAAWVFKMDIVAALPRTASAYALFGADVNPHGLEVQDLVVGMDEHGGLQVEGVLKNITDRAQETLPLRARVLDANGAWLAEWVIVLDQAALPRDGSAHFTTYYADPPAAAAEVEVLLAPDLRGEVAQSGMDVSQGHISAHESQDGGHDLPADLHGDDQGDAMDVDAHPTPSAHGDGHGDTHGAGGHGASTPADSHEPAHEPDQAESSHEDAHGADTHADPHH